MYSILRLTYMLGNVTCILSPKQILFNKSDEVSGNIPPFVLTTCNQSSQPEGQLLNGLITELKLAYGIVKLTVTNSATTDKQIMVKKYRKITISLFVF